MVLKTFYKMKYTVSLPRSVPMNSTDLILNIFEIKMASAMACTSHEINLRLVPFKASLCGIHIQMFLLLLKHTV